MIKRFGTLSLGLFLGFLLAFTSVHFLDDDITPQVISEASKLIGIDFTPAERDSMITELETYRESYLSIRDLELDYSPGAEF